MATDLLSPELLIALRLMLDTGALVLIWLVQLVIYPAFLHHKRAGFRVWHPIYTRRVTFVVLPIMLGQLAVYGWLMLTDRSWDVLLNFVLVLAAWANTFFLAVPLHAKLDEEDDHLPSATALLRVNWWRTGLWTVVWAVTVGVVFLA